MSGSAGLLIQAVVGKRLCRILVTDRGNYYLWTRAQDRREARAEQERELLALTVEIHTAYPVYGAERIARELKRQGFEVGRRRVARLLREHGIAATVLDLCSKDLIGYPIAPHMRASLAVEAITAAHRAALVAGNAIMHTDRGGQYHSSLYRSALKRLDIRRSTSRTGSCLDGAAAESFFATIKTGIGVGFRPDRASARCDIENWITSYNNRRLHSALGYRAPTEARLTWQERMATAA